MIKIEFLPDQPVSKEAQRAIAGQIFVEVIDKFVEQGFCTVSVSHGMQDAFGVWFLGDKERQ